MVNDIKIPDFNLDSNFSIDGDNTPKKAPPKKVEAPPPEPPNEEGKAPAAKTPVAGAKQGESPIKGKPKEESATSKPKPKLLFEEEEPVEFVSPQSVKANSKDKPSKAELKKLKEEKKKAEKPPKPEKPKKERKPIPKWVWTTPLVIIILGGIIYFFYSIGFFNTLMFRVSQAKNRIFVTDSARAVADSIKKAAEISLYESQFLRQKPETEKSKEEEKSKKATTIKSAATATKSTTPEKSTTTTTTKPATATTTKPATATTTKPATATTTKPATATTTKPATTTPTKPATTATRGPGKYSIQVCAWQTESAAKNEVRKISTTGLESRVVSVDIPKRGTWYRVMVGAYSTESEARGDLNRIMRITGYENCLVREN